MKLLISRNFQIRLYGEERFTGWVALFRGVLQSHRVKLVTLIAAAANSRLTLAHGEDEWVNGELNGWRPSKSCSHIKNLHTLTLASLRICDYCSTLMCFCNTIAYTLVLINIRAFYEQGVKGYYSTGILIYCNLQLATLSISIRKSPTLQLESLKYLVHTIRQGTAQDLRKFALVITHHLQNKM